MTKIAISRNDATKVIEKLCSMGQNKLATVLAKGINGQELLRLGIEHHKLQQQLKKAKDLYKKSQESMHLQTYWPSEDIRKAKHNLKEQKQNINRMESKVKYVIKKMKTTSSSRTNEVALVIPIHKKEVLLQKRTDGTWGLFGGHVDKGEKYKESAVREFEEETGFKIHKDNLIKIGAARGGKDKYFAFQTSKKFTVAPNKETKKAKWFTLEDLYKKKKSKVQPKLSRRLNKVSKFILEHIERH